MRGNLPFGSECSERDLGKVGTPKVREGSLQGGSRDVSALTIGRVVKYRIGFMKHMIIVIGDWHDPSLLQYDPPAKMAVRWIPDRGNT